MPLKVFYAFCMGDSISHVPLFRVLEANHFGKRFYGRKPLITGLDQVYNLCFLLDATIDKTLFNNSGLIPIH